MYAKALGEIGDARAVEPLIAALKDEDKTMRNVSVIALGRIGDAQAVQPLIAALEDTDKSLRSAAARALAIMYKSGKLNDAHQRLILARRGTINTIGHKDHRTHTDTGSGWCHNDSSCHTDSYIGVGFPI